MSLAGHGDGKAATAITEYDASANTLVVSIYFGTGDTPTSFTIGCALMGDMGLECLLQRGKSTVQKNWIGRFMAPSVATAFPPAHPSLARIAGPQYEVVK